MTTTPWSRLFAFCGACWQRRTLWVKGNVGYCTGCRPDWHPSAQRDGSQDGRTDG